MLDASEQALTQPGFKAHQLSPPAEVSLCYIHMFHSTKHVFELVLHNSFITQFVQIFPLWISSNLIWQMIHVTIGVYPLSHMGLYGAKASSLLTDCPAECLVSWLVIKIKGANKGKRAGAHYATSNQFVFFLCLCLCMSTLSVLIAWALKGPSIIEDLPRQFNGHQYISSKYLVSILQKGNWQFCVHQGIAKYQFLNNVR